MPSASTPSPLSVIAAAPASHPKKVRPSASNVIVANTGKAVHSFAARIPIRISARSENVSNNTPSAPAASPAVSISLNSAYASSNDNVPIGASSSPTGPISRSTFVPVPVHARRAAPTDAVTTSFTEYPCPASLCALAQKVFVRTISEPAAIYAL